MKRASLSTILAATSAIAIALSISSCIDPTYYPAGVDPVGVNNNGAKFKQDLERAIAGSDRIVVLQHSHSSDFTGIIPEASKAPYYSYGSRVLSSAAKSDFLARVRRLSAYNSRPSSEQFEPHHTIKFYSLGRLKSTMGVSFAISEVRWNGSRFTASQDIMRALDPIVSNAGFGTKRDWSGLARIEYTNGSRTSEGSIGAVGETPYTLGDPSVNPSSPLPPVIEPEPEPVKPVIPTAKKVPGKPGMVFNPFTQNHVDVNGLPSGMKVRDPQDPNGRVFRVP